jgi:hypothetical protein
LIAVYAIVTPERSWVNATALGRGPTEIDGCMEAQLAAEHHHWEEGGVTFITCNTVEQALKKKIITVFEPMYLEILNNEMVGFANTTAIYMLEHFFLSYGSITAVYLEHNFENMPRHGILRGRGNIIQTSSRLCGL